MIWLKGCFTLLLHLKQTCRMRKRFFTFACLLMIVFSLTSCDAGKRYTAANTRQPKFIGDIYLHGHTKTGIATNAVDTRTYQAQQTTAEAATTIETGYTEEQPALAEENTTRAERNGNERGTRYIFIKRRKASATPVVEEPTTTGPAPVPAEEIEPTGFKLADIMGLQDGSIQNNQLHSFINKWYGTRYRLGGDDQRGIDCSGFSRKLYGDVYGVEITRTAMEQYKACKRQKNTDGAEEGDLVFFRAHGKRISHVGVYLTNDYFVHSSTSQGVVISNLKDTYWHKHYAGIGKVAKGGDVTGL